MRGVNYAEAAELCRGSFVKEKVAAARDMFAALGDHRDSANADKIVSAAGAQLDRIHALDREIGLENLPRDLAELALLRVANPEASLADLARLADPPVTKSCINHRLRKLMRFRPEDLIMIIG